MGGLGVGEIENLEGGFAGEDAGADLVFARDDLGHGGENLAGYGGRDHSDAVVIAHQDVAGMDQGAAELGRDVGFARVGFGVGCLCRGESRSRRLEIQGP